jgi:TonB family protein
MRRFLLAPQLRLAGGSTSPRGIAMPQQRVSRSCACSLAAILGFALCLPSHAEQADSFKLPPHILSLHGTFYPDSARRLNQQGRVLVEFAISSQGRAIDPSIVTAEPQGIFEQAAQSYVNALAFEVPADWDASGGSRHRFRLSVVFALRPCPEKAPCGEPAQFPADASVKLTAGSFRQ